MLEQIALTLINSLEIKLKLCDSTRKYRIAHGISLEKPIQKARYCSFDGCKRKQTAKNFCQLHYTRMKNGNIMNKGLNRWDTTPLNCLCTVTGCTKQFIARGYCHTHYKRWQNGQDLNVPIKRINGGSIHRSGYRMITFNGKQVLEHRHIMEKHIGRKLDRYEVVHHKNHNKLDNRFENLRLMGHGEHTSLHHKGVPKMSMRGRKKNNHTGKYLS